MKILYHYCSLDTFISILKYKTIRFSEVNKLNDSREAKAIIDFLYKPIAEKVDVLLQECKILGELVIGMSRKNAIEYIVHEVIKQFLLYNDAAIYTFCLSETRDLLSQWRGYGDKGKGVAIGFDIEAMEKIESANTNIKFGKVEYISKLNYGSVLADSIVDRLSNQIVNAICNKELGRILMNPYGADRFDLWERLDILGEMIFYKNATFEAEQEYRLVYNPQTLKEDLLDEKVLEKDAEDGTPESDICPPIEFRSIGNDVISYFDLKFDLESAINTIVIGPNNKLQESDIIYMLKNYDLYESVDNINIVYSECTYIER